MTNDRRDFDPMGEAWNYILDETPAPEWRQLVSPGFKHATWPFRARHGYHSVRLAPDWCFYSWGDEIVSAEWTPAEPHIVRCRVTIERRYADPEFGHKRDSWTGTVVLDLKARAFQPWFLCKRDALRGVPADVAAEAAHKAGKLLAFFLAAIERWKIGDQARPVVARDLYVSDMDIGELEQEAAQHGDDAMAAISRVARGRGRPADLLVTAPDGEPWRRDDARRECRRVILDNRECAR